MLYLHFRPLFHLVYKIGYKKSKSSYLFIVNHEYLRVYLKSLNRDMWEALENFCKLNKSGNKSKITLMSLPNNTLLQSSVSKIISSMLTSSNSF